MFCYFSPSRCLQIGSTGSKYLRCFNPYDFFSEPEVSGNAAAALANLCSRVNNYTKIIEAWDRPNEGIRGFLIRFLKSDYATFEHIALWTILQLLESHNDKVEDLVKNDDDIINGVRKMADVTFERLQRSGIDVKNPGATTIQARMITTVITMTQDLNINL